MSTLTVTYPSVTLTASVADDALSGTILPFGEVGFTNLGAITASAGTLDIPTDPSELILNFEHDRIRPLGRGKSVTEGAEGIDAAFRVAGTTAGRDALIEASEGLRTGLSVEIEDPVIRGGQLIGGRLVAVGHVVDPAFNSARLAASLHPDTGETTDPEATASANEGDTTMTATVPETTAVETLTASAPTEGLAGAATGSHLSASRSDLFKIMAAFNSGVRTPSLMAALQDIVPGDILGIEQPQYVGELWSGSPFQRRFIPLFNHADLASFTVKGWRWVVKPEVANYAGNKGPVPSNAGVETEPVEIPAFRIAGAHDIDRKFVDFNDTAFFNAYYAAMTESYKKKSDAKVRSLVYAAAPAVVAGVVPDGVNPALAAVVDGIIAILNETDTMPDAASVSLDLWRNLLLVRKEDALEYLNAALGFEDGTLNNFRLLPMTGLTSEVLVSCRSAVTVHELGGEAPIRVEAVDIVNGGADRGVFGYGAVNVHDERGLARVAVTKSEG